MDVRLTSRRLLNTTINHGAVYVWVRLSFFAIPKVTSSPECHKALKAVTENSSTLRLKRKALWPPLKERDVPWGWRLWAPNRVPQSALDRGAFTPVQGWLLLCRLRHPILPGSQSWWTDSLLCQRKSSCAHQVLTPPPTPPQPPCSCSQTEHLPALAFTFFKIRLLIYFRLY